MTSSPLQSAAFYATIGLLNHGGIQRVYQTKRMAGYLFAVLAVLQMAAFFLYHEITSHVEIRWLVYLVYQIRSAALAAVPLITAAAMLLLFSAGEKRISLFPILPVLSYALYFLPDHYLFYMEQSLKSGEAIAMALIMTVLECAAIWGAVLLLFLIGKRALLSSGSAEKKEELPFFDLEAPLTKSVFFVCFSYFCLQVVIEIVRTISYLIANAGTYTLEEILTILISFAFHLGILFLLQAACILYLRYAKKHYAKEGEILQGGEKSTDISPKAEEK